ncbi:MAG TPA: hypothetical protein VJN67_17030 [Stellaceae bacterium]|nr:hypothetical protein [Stellaceae bacterium]
MKPNSHSGPEEAGAKLLPRNDTPLCFVAFLEGLFLLREKICGAYSECADFFGSEQRFKRAYVVFSGFAKELLERKAQLTFLRGKKDDWSDDMIDECFDLISLIFISSGAFYHTFCADDSAKYIPNQGTRGKITDAWMYLFEEAISNISFKEVNQLEDIRSIIQHNESVFLDYYPEAIGYLMPEQNIFTLTFDTISFVKNVLQADLVEITSNKGSLFGRSLDFQPHQTRAALSILSYFGSVLEARYPGMDVEVKIGQSGNKISLSIDSGSEDLEKIEESLDTYLEVARGRRPAEAIVSDPIDILRLQHQLDIAALQLKSEQDLRAVLVTENRGLHERLSALEERLTAETERFMTHLQELNSNQYNDHRAIVRRVLNAAEVRDREFETTLSRVIRVLLSGEKRFDKRSLKRDIEALYAKDHGFWRKLVRELPGGVLQGALGGYVHDLIISLGATLPH